jgi:peptide/nickel transport system substrate-binding protein
MKLANLKLAALVILAVFSISPLAGVAHAAQAAPLVATTQISGNPNICGGGHYGGTLNIAYGGDPGSFNRLISHSTVTAMISTQMDSTRLLAYGPGWVPINQLASNYSVTPDGKTWTFHIPNNITWSDGVPFTSQDIKFWYLALAGKLPGTAPTSTGSVFVQQNMTSITTPDNYTVIFNFNSFTPSALFSYINGDTPVAPQHLYPAGQNISLSTQATSPVGIGPFEFTSYTHGQNVILSKDPTYWKAGLPCLDSLNYQIIPDQQTAVNALLAGQVNYISEELGVPIAQLATINNTKGFEAKVLPEPTVYRLAINQRPDAVAAHPWLANLQVRTAIASAIDRTGIVSTVFHNFTTTNWGPVPRSMAAFYDPKIDSLAPKYNVTLANKMLDQAGYPRAANGTRFSADMPYLPDAGVDQAAQIIKAELAQVGININIIALDRNAYLNTYEYDKSGLGTTPFDIMGATVGPDPLNLNSQYLSTQTAAVGGFNTIWYNSSSADKYLLMGSSTNDLKTRQAAYYNASETIAKDMDWISLFNGFRTFAWSTNFAGFNNYGPNAYYATLGNIYSVNAPISGTPASTSTSSRTASSSSASTSNSQTTSTSATSTTSSTSNAGGSSVTTYLVIGVVLIVIVVGAGLFLRSRSKTG